MGFPVFFSWSFLSYDRIVASALRFAWRVVFWFCLFFFALVEVVVFESNMFHEQLRMCKVPNAKVVFLEHPAL